MLMNVKKELILASRIVSTQLVATSVLVGKATSMIQYTVVQVYENYCSYSNDTQLHSWVNYSANFPPFCLPIQVVT